MTAQMIVTMVTDARVEAVVVEVAAAVAGGYVA